jgi:hypothetical protein
MARLHVPRHGRRMTPAAAWAIATHVVDHAAPAADGLRGRARGRRDVAFVDALGTTSNCETVRLRQR